MSAKLFPDAQAPTDQNTKADDARPLAVSALDRLKPPYRREPTDVSTKNLVNTDES